jgi:hypothetical protein
MSRLVPPILAAAFAVVAALSIPAGACNPGPKPGPSAPLASIDLASETVTGDAANVSLASIDFGSDISLTIPSKSAPRNYALSIPLSSEESLSILSAGGAAITQIYPIPPGDYYGPEPPADYQDGLGDDNPDAEADPSEPAAPDDGTENIDDDQDPSWYPDGDAVDTGARDGSDVASDAFDQASNELPDGNWVMISAFDPPVATDVNGKPVPVSLAKSSDGLAVSISPSNSAAFPVNVELAYGYDPDSYDPPTSSGAGTGSRLNVRSALARSVNPNASAKASTACSGAEVVISASSGSSFLTDALRRWPTNCAEYYVSVAPEKDTDLPRGRPARKPGQPQRPLASAVIKALNKKVKTKKDLKNYPRWNDSGAKFIPLAEINFVKIDSSYNGEPYDQVGRDFANKMRQRGYDTWSIDEFAKFTTDPEKNVTLWNEYEALADNLYVYGNKNGTSKGVIFGAEPIHAPKKSNTIRDSKAKWKILFSNPNNYDWGDLAGKTKLWADEDYTLCSVVCVPGATLSQKAQYTNAYMQKIGRLAFANDAPSSVASTRSFLSTRFTNLINGWGAVEGKKNSHTNSYGTYDMSVEQIRKLVGLQVYAARSWMSSNSSYAGDRIGVRWVNRLDPANHWKKAKRAALARRIARAIAGAYGPGGSPVKACDPRAGRSSTGLCRPADSSATDFTQAKTWNTFRKWGGTGCQHPSNDNFGDARTITGPEGSIDGTTKCATWQSGETSPYGDATGSVWYRWDAPATDFPKFAKAVDSNNDYLETNLYTGDSLGDLTAVYNACGQSPGGTYWIQVVNRRGGGGDAPAGPFTLSWGTAGCYN